ncbi:MerR family transcriptional regulator [Bacteroidetes/Chlorobi group bacterium Naka2016]|jgi:hypothetical protein|nr:MAG: MerR family transcriptional regulator [Bacteroidetes/Chlorobi group bacterium Naka2016]
MDFRRYTINQLSRLTGTSRHLLRDWVRRGLLVPTQISGNRKKFSFEAFLEAERLALDEAQKSEYAHFVPSLRPYERIPDAFFDSLLNFNKSQSSGKAKRKSTKKYLSNKNKEDL